MYMYVVYSKKMISRCNDSREGAHVEMMREMAWQASLFKTKEETAIFALLMFILSHRHPPSEVIKLMNRHIAKKRNILSSFILSLSLNIL